MADTGETPVKQDEFLAFLKGYTPEAQKRGERDVLGGRWRILTNQPIAEYSSSYARAFAVRDERAPDASLYALVFDDGVPLRQKNIAFLKTYRHPALVSLLGEGMATIGTAGEIRYVVVLERPAGQPLSQILARREEPATENQILQQYLRPLTEILVAFTRAGISHNRIHPGNVYISPGKVTLGECISEPSGYSQDPMFEPVERMLTNPRGKADFAPGADCYALAILTLHLALGFAPFANLSKETLTRGILSNGPYHTLIMPWDTPTGLQDFLRGVITDGRRERWDVMTIQSWLSGRRFNLVIPTTARETSRGFEFMGDLYFNRKSLAYAMSQHWKEGLAAIADNRIPRWLKIHAHKQDIAGIVAKALQVGATLNPQQEDAALARVIILLDPQGPLRLRQISVSIEGIGALLAHAYSAERHEDVALLMQMLEAELPTFWLELQKATPETNALSIKLQKARNRMNMKGLGFGIERCLYDLNPTLPCLSPMLAGQHVTTLSGLLEALDAVSARKAASDEPGDRHIAAFIASRLDITKELSLPNLQLPALKNNQTLLMLQLLARATHKTKEHSLKGLNHWIALKVLPLLSTLHSRSRQRKLTQALRGVAAQGSPEELSQLLAGGAAFETDRREFHRAASDYAARKAQIASLQGTSGISRQADLKGHGVAQTIAYGICIATVYTTLKAYFHL